MEGKKKKIISIAASVLIVVIVIASVLFYNANKIITYQLQQFLGKGFSVGSISLGFNGARAEDIVMNRPDGQKALSVESLKVRASLIGLLKKQNIISDIELASPFLLIEQDKKGSLILPEAAPSQKKEAAAKSSEQARQKFLVNHIGIKNGSVDYKDAKISNPPALLKLSEIDADIENISIPPDNIVSEYTLSASVPGRTAKGSLRSGGKINLLTKDTKSSLTIKEVDIVPLRPYYEKKGDVEVTKGLLSVNAEIVIKDSKINSTGKIMIRDLEFKSGSGKIMGLPLAAVTKLLKDNNNQITLDFAIEGDINNPKFSIKESLLQRLTLSLAKTLGMPIEAIGKSVFDVGGSVLKKIFK